MGVRYGGTSTPASLASLPAAARTVITASLSDYRQVDRGLVRRGNDRTLDNRATKFRDWICEECQLTPDHITGLKQLEIEHLLGAYLHKLIQAPVAHSRQPPMANTLRRHLDAANLYLQSVVETPFCIYTRSGPTPKLVPLLHDTIQLRQKWQQPREKRLPYTLPMFQILYEQVTSALRCDPLSFLDLQAAVFDWVRLGIFTGCRASEYAQTKAKKGEFSKVPNTAHAGSWAGTPIAFMASDFAFYDDSMHLLTHHQAINNPSIIYEFHLRYRFDKSSANFTIKKYSRGVDYLCPIDAAVTILARAYFLDIGELCPVGIYRHANGYTYIRSDDVIRVMRQACIDAYPDPRHYLRVHIRSIVSHSNRVTAAVVLRSMGLDIHAIAFRLRWQPDSVQHYIRECNHTVEEVTRTAFKGVWRLS